MGDVGDWSQAASALFTAGTAYYAWRSIRMSEREWRSTKEPDLHLEVLLNEATGTTDISFMNDGGTARAVPFAAAVGTSKAYGYVGDGFVKRGERVSIHTSLPRSEAVEAMLMYRGIDQASYVTKRAEPRELLRAGATRAHH